jgi:exonuclease SbcC
MMAKTALVRIVEHPNVSDAEDVSEQLAIVEAKILKLESEIEIAATEKKAFKIENDIAHAVEQLRLTLSIKIESDSKIHLQNSFDSI